MTRSKRFLVVGNGAREHALAWALSHARPHGHVFVLPGNGGTAMESNVGNVGIAVTDIAGIIRFAQAQEIDLIVPGPEAPLVAGIADMAATETSSSAISAGAKTLRLASCSRPMATQMSHIGAISFPASKR